MLFTKVILIIILIIIFIATINYSADMYKNSFIIDIWKINNILRLKNDFYKILLYKSKYEMYNYMITIYPQNYHFFIYNGILIYHPSNKYLDGILKQYYCDDGFELAYELPIKNLSTPKIICHKKLNYLKTYIYKNKSIYEKSFDELQNPIVGINSLITDIIKNG